MGGDKKEKTKGNKIYIFFLHNINANIYNNNKTTTTLLTTAIYKEKKNINSEIEIRMHLNKLCHLQ